MRNAAARGIGSSRRRAAATTAAHPTQTLPSFIGRGQVLHAGQTLASDFGQGMELTLQTGGNLVLSVVTSGRTPWSTNTSGAGNYVQMQTDGNAVLRSAAGAALWSTGTARTPGVEFGVNVSGNAFVTSGQQIWSSPNPPAAGNQGIVVYQLVSPTGHYRALLQSDGNLVLYGTHALWSTHTSVPCNTGTFVQMQDDGNFVLYANYPRTHPIWSTHTLGRNEGASQKSRSSRAALRCGGCKAEEESDTAVVSRRRQRSRRRASRRAAAHGHTR